MCSSDLWKYFATSHGKGVVDGIGGRAKSLVRQKIMTKGEATTVQSAVEFADLVTKLMPSTKTIYISKEEIDTSTREANLWSDARSIPGIKKIHKIQACYQESLVKFWNTSDDEDPAFTTSFPLAKKTRIQKKCPRIVRGHTRNRQKISYLIISVNGFLILTLVIYS